MEALLDTTDVFLICRVLKVELISENLYKAIPKEMTID